MQRGHHVIILDNLQEGHRAAVPPAARFCLADLANRQQIEEVFASLPRKPLSVKSVRKPSKFYAANVANGINLLDVMVRHGVNRLIFSSTAATYGTENVVPITEEHPTVPVNPYGKSKLVLIRFLRTTVAYTGLKGSAEALGLLPQSFADVRVLIGDPKAHVKPAPPINRNRNEDGTTGKEDGGEPDGRQIVREKTARSGAPLHLKQIAVIPRRGGSCQAPRVGKS